MQICPHIQCTLGTEFILSALLKVASFASFVQETGAFMEAYSWSASKTEMVVLAVGVCAVEFILGVLTFVKRCAFCNTFASETEQLWR